MHVALQSQPATYLDQYIDVEQSVTALGPRVPARPARHATASSAPDHH